jgi:hypothetical protein
LAFIDFLRAISKGIGYLRVGLGSPHLSEIAAVIVFAPRCAAAQCSAANGASLSAPAHPRNNVGDLLSVMVAHDEAAVQGGRKRRSGNQ